MTASAILCASKLTVGVKCDCRHWEGLRSSGRVFNTACSTGYNEDNWWIDPIGEEPGNPLHHMTYMQPILLLTIALTFAGVLRFPASRGRSIAIGGILALLLVSWPPLDWLWGLPLEARYPIRPFVAFPGMQAIVVLGSSVRPPEYGRPF